MIVIALKILFLELDTLFTILSVIGYGFDFIFLLVCEALIFYNQLIKLKKDFESSFGNHLLIK